MLTSFSGYSFHYMRVRAIERNEETKAESMWDGVKIYSRNCSLFYREAYKTLMCVGDALQIMYSRMREKNANEKTPNSELPKGQLIFRSTDLWSPRHDSRPCGYDASIQIIIENYSGKRTNFESLTK